MLAIRRAGQGATYAPFRRASAVAFGDGRDLCPCHRAAAPARRPLVVRAALRGRQRPAGARLRLAAVRPAFPR